MHWWLWWLRNSQFKSIKSSSLSQKFLIGTAKNVTLWTLKPTCLTQKLDDTKRDSSVNYNGRLQIKLIQKYLQLKLLSCNCYQKYQKKNSSKIGYKISARKFKIDNKNSKKSLKKSSSMLQIIPPTQEKPKIHKLEIFFKRLFLQPLHKSNNQQQENLRDNFLSWKSQFR